MYGYIHIHMSCSCSRFSAAIGRIYSICLRRAVRKCFSHFQADSYSAISFDMTIARLTRTFC